MSVIYGPLAPEGKPATSYDEFESNDILAGKVECFYCYDTLTVPVVMWMGNGASIYLHPVCATNLMIRLMRDVHETQCRPKRRDAHERQLRAQLRVAKQ